MGDFGRCRHCGAPILWALSPRGAWLPLDPEPVEVAAKRSAALDWVVTSGQATRWAGEAEVWVAHPVVCPPQKPHPPGDAPLAERWERNRARLTAAAGAARRGAGMKLDAGTRARWKARSIVG